MKKSFTDEYRPNILKARLTLNKKLHISEQPNRGRPRDPDLEDRVFDTVMNLYADGGWAEVTFEAVARDAGTGKSSLYRRWEDRQSLLRSALEARWLTVDRIDNGSLKADLRELADMMLVSRTGDYANLQTWFAIDARRFPEIRTVTEPYIEQTIKQGRAIVRRAVNRGEVPPTFKPALLMDLIVGAVTNHVSTTPPHLKATMMKKAPEFLDELVEVVLKGASAHSR